MEYKQFIDSFIDILKSDKSVALKVFNGFNAVGREYFGNRFQGSDLNVNDEHADMVIENIIDNIKALNKKEFIQEMEESGMEFYENEDSVAFDDSYRHSAIVDITDITNPIVENPCNCAIFKDASKDEKYFYDYCFTWLAVNKYAMKFLEAGKIIIHNDMMEQIYFPLPS